MPLAQVFVVQEGKCGFAISVCDVQLGFFSELGIGLSLYQSGLEIIDTVLATILDRCRELSLSHDTRGGIGGGLVAKAIFVASFGLASPCPNDGLKAAWDIVIG